MAQKGKIFKESDKQNSLLLLCNELTAKLSSLKHEYIISVFISQKSDTF